ncbi:hypothetical protein KFE25_005677 [Diacronema lutheri]|uniref:Uncharacterized protein n=1 Tax=Diacronema lutheri TaxID=2081491 RepID=A0A8J5X618_DIALT|nr:hypothetical protein KFE25_005677 [Diacronema lutheri]
MADVAHELHKPFGLDTLGGFSQILVHALSAVERSMHERVTAAAADAAAAVRAELDSQYVSRAEHTRALDTLAATVAADKSAALARNREVHGIARAHDDALSTLARDVRALTARLDAEMDSRRSHAREIEQRAGRSLERARRLAGGAGALGALHERAATAPDLLVADARDASASSHQPPRRAAIDDADVREPPVGVACASSPDSSSGVGAAAPPSASPPRSRAPSSSAPPPSGAGAEPPEARPLALLEEAVSQIISACGALAFAHGAEGAESAAGATGVLAQQGQQQRAGCEAARCVSAVARCDPVVARCASAAAGTAGGGGEAHASSPLAPVASIAPEPITTAPISPAPIAPASAELRSARAELAVQRALIAQLRARVDEHSSDLAIVLAAERAREAAAGAHRAEVETRADAAIVCAESAASAASAAADAAAAARAELAALSARADALDADARARAHAMNEAVRELRARLGGKAERFDLLALAARVGASAGGTPGAGDELAKLRARMHAAEQALGARAHADALRRLEAAVAKLALGAGARSAGSVGKSQALALCLACDQPIVQTPLGERLPRAVVPRPTSAARAPADGVHARTGSAALGVRGASAGALAAEGDEAMRAAARATAPVGLEVGSAGRPMPSRVRSAHDYYGSSHVRHKLLPVGPASPRALNVAAAAATAAEAETAAHAALVVAVTPVRAIERSASTPPTAADGGAPPAACVRPATAPGGGPGEPPRMRRVRVADGFDSARARGATHERARELDAQSTGAGGASNDGLETSNAPWSGGASADEQGDEADLALSVPGYTRYSDAHTG